MPEQNLEHSAATDVGRKRDNNEDRYLSLPERGLWLVADGMGGHAAGEVASAIVCDTLMKQKNPGDLAQTIQRSHRAILAAPSKGVGSPGMGSTVVALHSQGHQYEVAWVGDSRAYLWTNTPKGGQLERLTTDHSYVQMLLDTGAIKASEVESHPDKNIITQCLGSPELQEVHVDFVQGQWQQDQWILLCTDGLTDELDDQTIARLLQRSAAPKAAVHKLMEAALAGGGRDNVTLQIIQSPLTRRSPWSRLVSTLWQWVPSATGRSSWDMALYSTALVSLLLLLYWVLL